MKNESAAIWVKIDSLKPWADNPRQNDSAVSSVVDSIKRFGFASPIIARKETNEIIAGHTRFKAAQVLKLDKVPVRFMDLDPVDSKLLALADNRVAELADWDDEGLSDILSELSSQGIDLDGLGWSEEELEAVMGAFDVAALDGLPELDPNESEFAQVTFTLTHDQKALLNNAVDRAKEAGVPDETGNTNSNGNAIAMIAEHFLSQDDNASS